MANIRRKLGNVIKMASRDWASNVWVKTTRRTSKVYDRLNVEFVSFEQMAKMANGKVDCK